MLEILKQLFKLKYRLMLKEENNQVRITIVDKTSGISASLLHNINNDAELYFGIEVVKNKLTEKLK